MAVLILQRDFLLNIKLSVFFFFDLRRTESDNRRVRSYNVVVRVICPSCTWWRRWRRYDGEVFSSGALKISKLSWKWIGGGRGKLEWGGGRIVELCSGVACSSSQRWWGKITIGADTDDMPRISRLLWVDRTVIFTRRYSTLLSLSSARQRTVIPFLLSVAL